MKKAYQVGYAVSLWLENTVMAESFEEAHKLGMEQAEEGLYTLKKGVTINDSQHAVSNIYCEEILSKVGF